MNIRTKLWLVTLVSVVSSIALVILLSKVVARYWNPGYDLNQLKAVSNEVLRAVDQQGAIGREGIQSVLDSAHRQNPALRLEWIADDGTVLYDTAGLSQRYGFKQLADRMQNMPDTLWSEDGTITLAYSVSKGGHSWYLLLSLPSEAMKSGQYYFFTRTYETLIIFTLPIPISAMVPYFLSLWFFSSINRRIRKLNTALNQVSLHGDMIVLADKSKDEIGQLTRHYNEMAQRIHSQSGQIEQFENRRRLLLSNLSHDLRTPLTMILGYAETIRAGLYQNEKELHTSAKIILQRSRYMDKLLDQLLSISRQEAGALDLHLAPVDLSELVRKIVADYLLFLDGQNFTVEVEIPDEEVEALVDASLVERAIRNLLDNAVRYGSDGHFLGVRLAQEGETVCITVKDTGKGVAPEDHERVFERFYRAGAGRKGDGLGIGLSIVKEIVALHKGEIHLRSTPHVETLFQIRLPVTPLSPP